MPSAALGPPPCVTRSRTTSIPPSPPATLFDRLALQFEFFLLTASRRRSPTPLSGYFHGERQIGLILLTFTAFSSYRTSRDLSQDLRQQYKNVTRGAKETEQTCELHTLILAARTHQLRPKSRNPNTRPQTRTEPARSLARSLAIPLAE